MAKDRFNNKASYDNNFKYGLSELSYKSLRTVTSEQTDFLKRMYHNPKLNNWEKNFLKTVTKQNSISDKQIEIISRIHRLKNK